MNNICCRLFLNSLVHKTPTSTYSLLSPLCCVAIEPFNLFPFLCGPTIFVKGLQGQRTSLKLEAPPFHHHHQHHSSKETTLLMFQSKSAYTPCKCYTLLIYFIFFSYILLLCSWKRRLSSSQLPDTKNDEKHLLFIFFLVLYRNRGARGDKLCNRGIKLLV